MIIKCRDICKNCDLGLKRSDCSENEFEECYEQKYEMTFFRTMLNSSIQRLNLDKDEVVKMLDEIYD